MADGRAGAVRRRPRGLDHRRRRSRRRQRGEAGRARLRRPRGRRRRGRPAVRSSPATGRANREAAARAALEWLIERGRGGGRRVTRTAAELGAGLAPGARPHDRSARASASTSSGIAGAGRLGSRAARRGRRRDRDRLRPGRPVAVHAGARGRAASRSSGPTTPPTSTRRRRPDRLAVTKALTAIAPDHPELRAAREPGHPGRAVAAGRRRRRVRAHARRRRRHARQEHDRRLADVGARGGRPRSVGVRRGAAAGGADRRVPGDGAARARGASFVVEADEYAGNFDAYRPDVVVLTTVEWDHPDVFADRAAVIDAFARWLGRVPDATLVANVERSRASWSCSARVQASAVARGGSSASRSVADAGAGPSAPPPSRRAVDRPAPDRRGSSTGRRRDGARRRWPGVGRRAGCTCRPWGTTTSSQRAGRAAAPRPQRPGVGADAADRLLWALGSFPGIGRRLERKGEAGGVVVYDDYGHHPTAIRATLAALRQREPGRRVWAVYEPLTFHRTAAMLDEFADALAEADAVAVADIWASRDPDTTITSPEALAAGRARAAARHHRDGARDRRGHGRVARAATSSDGDAVLVMGGGQQLPDRGAAARGTSQWPILIAERGANGHTGARQQPQLRCGQHAAPAQEANDGEWRGLVRRRQRVRRPGAPQRARPGPARDGAAVRLPRRHGRPRAGQGRARPRHRRRVPGDRGQGPHPVEGRPPRAVAEDLRLGAGRAGGRQQGPPEDRPAAAACRTTSRSGSPS